MPPFRGAARDPGEPAESLAIERPAAAVSETDVDAMIENMRRQRPVFTPVERAARDSDRVVFDYQARIGGKPFEGSDLTDVRIVLGTRQAMPELEEGLKGVRAGEQRTVSAVFPPLTRTRSSPASPPSCISPLRQSRNTPFRRSTMNSFMGTVSNRAGLRKCAPRFARAWSGSLLM